MSPDKYEINWVIHILCGLQVRKNKVFTIPQHVKDPLTYL